MSTIITEIYDALREAGASDERARKADDVIASFDSRHSNVKHEFAVMRGEFNTVKWMLAPNLTLTLLVLGKLFLH